MGFLVQRIYNPYYNIEIVNNKTLKCFSKNHALQFLTFLFSYSVDGSENDDIEWKQSNVV